ncbi:MAG: acyl-CoA dehydrogenase family protein [Ilumatobacteraceae bacterium]|nr:acyl-CoA dehydrogenase family protein [Ilumatobacteraceae bacterium]
MSTTEAPPTASGTDDADPVAAVTAWLEEQWDPDLTVAEWWERLGTAGWSAPNLPVDRFGRGLSRSDATAVHRAISDFGALGPPSGLGLLLAAPTIASHGTQEQVDTFVRDIVTGQQAWCQLFSEPGAGSDLAGLSCRAERDGEEWIVNGQKVWTSGGHMADVGMLIARTNPSAPKHRGISWMAIDMDQPGVEIRPLRELTGHALFNEVFLTDARVRADALIGDENDGWRVANTTLQNERAGLGAGGGGTATSALPGSIAGQLDRRVGDLVGGAAPRRRQTGAARRSQSKMYAGLARSRNLGDDASIRQDLMRLHTLETIGAWNGARVKAARAAGEDIAGMANISKLMMSDVVRLSRDLGLRIVGAAGTLHAYTDEQRAALDEATGDPMLAVVTGTALYAQAPPIYGGTDQIQKNIIGERALGLPKEPGDTRDIPFSDLPKNG